MSAADHGRAVKILTAILAVAVVTSIVHYTDNYLAFDQYPKSDTGPNITADTIWISWVILTAAGVGGYLLYRRRQIRAAVSLLAVYSLSGLVGIGHYSAPGMSQLAWWRHLHIGVDIACGVAVFAFAVWSARRVRRPAFG